MLIKGRTEKLILIKQSQLVLDKLAQWYGDNFMAMAIPEDAASKKAFLQDLKEVITDETKVILVADSEFFKRVAKVKKSAGYEGLAVDTAYGIPAFVVPNYESIFYNPAMKDKIQFAMSKVNEYLQGNYKPVGEDIIEHAEYPQGYVQIAEFLNKLHVYPALTVDIETAGTNMFNLTPKEEAKFGSPLHHFCNRIYSIAFAWNEHSGGSFCITDGVLELLKNFFTCYEGKLVFHNAGFDVTQIIYHCWMSDLSDFRHMLEGLHIMCNKLEDTMLITYLATNSCAGNELGLKPLSHEFTGNYAEDVSDVTRVPVKDLLVYNLKDALATWYVYKKYYPIMEKENQKELYYSLFLPTLKVLIETQLVGFRIYPERLEELNRNLTSYSQKLVSQIKTYPWVKKCESELRRKASEKYNNTHKKQKTSDDFDTEFNPNSTAHLAMVLYDILGLPVLDYTDKGNPATGAEDIEKLVNHAPNDYVKEFLKALTEYSAVAKILSAFIPAFERTPDIDTKKALYGSFKLGGTVSGRLSSKSPNLQNLPATGSVYAKPVKRIFGYPLGYIFVGADQRSLEDRISALTTKDKEKIKVYTDGYDGHSLRAYAYFREKMPDIQLAKPGHTYYKVTKDDGEVIYCDETKLLDTVQSAS